MHPPEPLLIYNRHSICVTLRFAVLRLVHAATALLIASVALPATASGASRLIQPPPDPPKREKVVDVTWTCSYDAATKTFTKTASDPGAGNAVNATVKWRSYYAPTPSGATDLSRSYDYAGTDEACLGVSDYYSLGTQIRADEIATVVYNLAYPAVVTAPSPEYLPDGTIRRVIVNSLGQAPPRLAVGGRGDADPRFPNRMAPIVASKNGIDRTGDGISDVVVNAATWLVDIDAPRSYGFVDLREVPAPPLSNMRIQIGTADLKRPYLRGYVGPVRLYGPHGTVNMFVDTGDAADYIELGAGNDYVTSSGGSDVIRTGAGDDVVWGGSGLHDLIYAGDGDDYIHGDDGRGAGRDTIFLGSGDDVGFGAGGNGNRVYGQNGNDLVSTGGKFGLIDLGPGIDFALSWNRDTRVACGTGRLDSGPSKPEHHAGRFSGCEKAYPHPITPHPYIAASNQGTAPALVDT